MTSHGQIYNNNFIYYVCIIDGTPDRNPCMESCIVYTLYIFDTSQQLHWYMFSHTINSVVQLLK